ncbi:type II secretion system protein M [Bordetella petrii]|nr:type II secretion system protein M [Bordetella petrii]
MGRAGAWRQRARAWYAHRPRREQQLLAGAGALAAAALVFLVLIEPAWSTLARARHELPGLRTQAAAVADLTAQVRALRRQGAGTANASVPSVAELDASLRRAGLPDDSWSLSEAPMAAGASDRPAAAISLALREAPSAALFRWLDTAARDWRLSVSDAELTRATLATGRRLPGRLNGTLTLLPAGQP